MSKNREFQSERNYDFYGDNVQDIGEEHFSHKKERANKRWEKIKRKKSRWSDDEDNEN